MPVVFYISKSEKIALQVFFTHLFSKESKCKSHSFCSIKDMDSFMAKSTAWRLRIRSHTLIEIFSQVGVHNLRYYSFMKVFKLHVSSSLPAAGQTFRKNSIAIHQWILNYELDLYLLLSEWKALLFAQGGHVSHFKRKISSCHSPLSCSGSPRGAACPLSEPRLLPRPPS